MEWLPIFGNFDSNQIAMGKNTSISLGTYFEEFIQSELNTGRYSSASDVIRSALRLLETEATKEKELIKALKNGEESRFVDQFDPKKNLEQLHSKHL